MLSIPHTGMGGLTFTPITVYLEPRVVDHRMVREALSEALKTPTPQQAVNRFLEKIITKLTEGSSFTLPGGLGPKDALLSCAHTAGRLPVKLDTRHLPLVLRQLATAYDAGTPEDQHFALCFEGVTGLTKRCYGTYIDKQYIDKVLGNRTITIFAGTCAATLLACESLRGLIAGAVLGAIEAGAVCGIPAATAAATRNTIAEQLEQSKELTWYLGPPTKPTQAGTVAGLTIGSLLGIYRFAYGAYNFDFIKKAANYLISNRATGETAGKTTKIRGVFGKIATKEAERYVNNYFNALFGDIKELKDLGTAQKARVITAAEKPDDLAKIYAALKLAKSQERSEIVSSLTKLAEGKAQDLKEVLNTATATLQNSYEKLKALKTEVKTLRSFRTNLDNRVKLNITIENGKTEGYILIDTTGLQDTTIDAVEDRLRNVEGVTGIIREDGQMKVLVSGDVSPNKLKDVISQTVDDLLEELAKEIDEIAEYIDEAGELTSEVRRLAKNPAEKVHKTSKKTLLREIVEGALCTGVAYLAGSLTSWTITGFPPSTPPTLDITLTNNTLKIGTLTVG